nr:3-coathanger stack domain-containing protein [uncultured Emticicia sp.]
MKKIFLLFTLLVLSLLSFGQAKIAKTISIKDDPEGRLNAEFLKIADPQTKSVPFDELEKARGLMGRMIKTMSQIPGIDWKERGPNNVGGRIRALMFDPKDATKKKVWAGGVAGGLWYNNDITSVASSWQKVFDFWDNMAVSCIAYDPSNTNIIYVGTGEGYGNADAVQGGGIWKTIDGGLTWNRLATTIPSYTVSSGQSYAFQTVQKIVVSSSGRVFAGTKAGVWISTNGGASWALAAGLPSGASNTSFVSDLEIGTDNVVYAAFGYFSRIVSQIYKTNNINNDGSSWATITPPTPYLASPGARTEIALAPSTSGTSQVIYAVAHAETTDRPVAYFRKSIDAGVTWADLTVPFGGSPSFIATQGWYDMILAVHTTNPNIVFAGGASHARTIDGGTSWINDYGYSNPVHPDHHAFVFRPNSPNEVVMGNDGGIYYSADWGNSSITTPTYGARNKDLNVTQFYAASMKNIAYDGYLIGGLQDNNSVKILGTYNTVGSSVEVLGGDGMVSFIDQDNPGYQFVTTQYNNYYLLNENGSIIKNLIPKYDGQFVNPSDYDSSNNTLYSYEGYYSPPGTTDIARYVISNISDHSYNYFSMTGNVPVSFIKAGLAANTVFIGTSSGFVYKLTGITGVDGNIPTLTTVLNPTQIADEFGNISCIEIGANENELLITKSNYNVKSVYYTNNGGSTWTSKDESTYGLPNIPVRYALFNPLNRQQVLIATELGVWTTSNITANNPEWAPTNANLAHVRCDMLKFRTSDNTVLVATHGRGLFTTQLNTTIPCQTVMMLVAPYDNKTSGTTTYNKTETISATNQISGTANVTYKASKSIELKPLNPTDGTGGFKVEAGAVFHAYISGCNN